MPKLRHALIWSATPTPTHLSLRLVSQAFSAFDRSGNGTVTPLEFRRVLDHFCAHLSDPQFRFLLDRMKLNWENHTVYWRDFLNQFNLCNLDVCDWVCVCVWGGSILCVYT